MTYGESAWGLADDVWGTTASFWTGQFLFSVGHPAAAPKTLTAAGQAPAAVAVTAQTLPNDSRAVSAPALIIQTAVTLP